MAWLFTDPRFERHETGAHPEAPARTRAIRERLAQSGHAARCRDGETRRASEEDLRRVHATQMVSRVRKLAEAGGGRVDADTVVSAESFDIALLAAGTAMAAVDAVVTSDDQRAFCAVRPPGHHATKDQAMGFCLANNVAVAAAHARATHDIERVLIVDWDVHHGNGTQDIFYEDRHVGFFSAHRYPFYPGTGSAEERGRGDGTGTTWNLPVEMGTSREQYRTRFEKMLTEAADTMQPQLVILSAGFDAHRLDPIGSLGLETEDFGTLREMVIGVSEQYADGRLVSVLEGGYHIEALADSVQIHVERLLA